MRANAPRIATSLLCQALAAMLAGCGGGDSGSGTTPPPPSAPAPSPAPVPTPTPTPAPTPTPVPTAVSGLDARPANATCLAGAPSDGSVSMNKQRVFPNLAFSQPVAMMQAPNSSARWYVVEKTGRVRVFDNNASVATSSVFIDVTSRLDSSADERGLLGMAFHPDWPTDPRVYLFYTANDATLGMVDRVSEFRSTDGGATLSPATELVLFNVDDPETNHNGGNIAFGPD